MKSYEVYWIDENGNQMLIGAGESKSLQHVCFNRVCGMIPTAPSLFPTDCWEHNEIIKNIHKGRNPDREHWFAILGEQVISVIETIEQKNKRK